LSRPKQATLAHRDVGVVATGEVRRNGEQHDARDLSPNHGAGC
jgi:hypothetical protein